MPVIQRHYSHSISNKKLLCLGGFLFILFNFYSILVIFRDETREAKFILFILQVFNKIIQYIQYIIYAHFSYKVNLIRGMWVLYIGSNFICQKKKKKNPTLYNNETFFLLFLVEQ